MRKMFCRAAIAFAMIALFAGAPSIYAQEATAYDLESSLMKYILCYEAYKEAKQSENPEVRADLANYVKEYREAYAEYLQLLREADLYQPDKKDVDPANDFNKKRVSRGGKKIKWGDISNDKERQRIKKAIKEGKSIKEIMSEVDDNLPKNTLSTVETPIELDDNDGVIYGNEGVNTGDNTGNFSGSNENVIYKNPANDIDKDDDGRGNPYWNGSWGKDNNGRGNGYGGGSSFQSRNGTRSQFSNCPWVN